MPEAVTADLIRALIENMKGARDDWASLAMVIDLSGGRISGTHGYAYSPDGTVSAVASRPSGVRPAVEEPIPQPFAMAEIMRRALGLAAVLFALASLVLRSSGHANRTRC